MLRINAVNTQNEDTEKAKQNKPIQRVNTQSNRAWVRHTTRSTNPRQVQVQAPYKLKSWTLSQEEDVNAFWGQLMERSIK